MSARPDIAKIIMIEESQTITWAEQMARAQFAKRKNNKGHEGGSRSPDSSSPPNKSSDDSQPPFPNILGRGMVPTSAHTASKAAAQAGRSRSPLHIPSRSPSPPWAANKPPSPQQKSGVPGDHPQVLLASEPGLQRDSRPVPKVPPPAPVRSVSAVV